MDAINLEYCVDATGVEQICDGLLHSEKIVHSSDQRDFSGACAQADIKETQTLDVLLGIRLNHTRETACGPAIDNTGPAPVVAFDGLGARTTTRLSRLAGVSWHAWASGRNTLTLYGDWRNSCKPQAINFGPEAEVQVLEAEAANSYKSNAVRVGGYTTLDATIGFHFGSYGIRLSGYNLTDRRDATSLSDRHGSVTVTATEGYYRLLGRTALAVVTAAF